VKHCYLSTPALYLNFVGFKDFTAVAMKITVFWDITPCSPLKVSRHFGGTFRIHLHDRKISRTRNQREIRWQAESTTLKMEAICLSKLLVEFQRATRLYIPEESSLPVFEFARYVLRFDLTPITPLTCVQLTGNLTFGFEYLIWCTVHIYDA
jgi:hypothetical protein